MKYPLLSSIGLTLLAGCSNTSLNAVDRMTGAAQNDGYFSRLVQAYPLQSRFLSINGQLPIDTAGLPCIASGYRVAYSMICFSGTKTRLLEHSFEYREDASGKVVGLGELKQALKDLDTLAADSVTATLALGQCRQKRATTPDKLSECNTLQTGAGKAQLQFTQKQGEVLKKLQDNNLFIFNWSEKAEGSAEADAGDMADASASASMSRSGFTIVAGLRLTQLLVGNDMARIYQGVPDFAKIPTFIMQAKHLAYSTSSNLAFNARIHLNLSPDQYRELLESLTEAEKISLTASMGYARSLTNAGQFSTVNKRLIELPAKGAGFSTGTSVSEGNGYQTFYSTMTDLEDLLDLAENLPQAADMGSERIAATSPAPLQ